MRLAIAGKGGAGKTTLSATIARLVARDGGDVVAIDADANPNLGIALGVAPDVAAAVRPVPATLVSRRLADTGLTMAIDSVLDLHATPAPDGVRLLAMGAPTHAEEGCLCAAHAVVSSLLQDLGGSERLVVVDMEASPEHLSRGTIRHVDAVCLVAEPYYRSLETVRRMEALVAELPVPRTVVVANKVRTAADGAAIEAFCERHGFELAGAVPWTEAVLEADRLRVPLVDLPGSTPVTSAVTSLVSALYRSTARSDRPPSAGGDQVLTDLGDSNS